MNMNETVGRAMQNSTLAPLAQKYRTAQVDLLILVGITLLNIVLLFTGSSTYFLFSGAVPYYIVFFGMLFCGVYPEMQSDPELIGLVFFPSSAIVWFVLLALAILGVYAVLYVFSRKHYRFLSAALVLVAIDTAAMLFLGGISVDNAIDLLFHAWMLYSLFVGIRAAKVLVSTPIEDTVLPPSAYSEIEDETAEESEAVDPTETDAPTDPIVPAEVSALTDLVSIGEGGDPATSVAPQEESDPTDVPMPTANASEVTPKVHITSNKKDVDPANFTQFHDLTPKDPK